MIASQLIEITAAITPAIAAPASHLFIAHFHALRHIRAGRADIIFDAISD